MRVLPGIESAAFDVSTEVFTLMANAGTQAAPILDAIRNLGFQPELLKGPATGVKALTRITAPESDSVRQALVRARKRGVPLIVDFGATWCGPCKTFANTTLADERVKHALQDFELLTIDIDEDPTAAKDFAVAGVPDIWFLAPDGYVLARENRCLAVDEFLATLASVR